MNQSKAKACEILLKEGKMTTSKCKSLIKRLGWSILEFGRTSDDNAATDILSKLQMEAYAETCKSFACRTGEYKLVFVRAGLPDAEQLILLTHELGHIVLDHPDDIGVLGCTAIQEQEANVFSEVLRHPTLSTYIHIIAKRHKRMVAIIFLALAVSISCYTAISQINSPHLTDNTKVYVTTDGDKFHKRTCHMVADRANIMELTYAEAAQRELEPCQLCYSELAR